MEKAPMEKIRYLISPILARFRLESGNSERPFWRSWVLIGLSGMVALVLVAKVVFTNLNAPLPTISLVVPKESETVFEGDLYVRGAVFPLGSKVKINDQGVSLNGDGTFTAIIKIQEGQNTLRVTAEKQGKTAEFLRLVERDLTPEEKQAREAAKTKAEQLATTEALSKDQEIAQVQAAYTQNQAKKVRVLSNQIKEEHGLKKVTGKVVNDTDQRAYWVKVTATFFDKQGNTLDEKLAFAVSFNKFLKPGEEAAFETQTIDKPFDRYQLDVSWEKE